MKRRRYYGCIDCRTKNRRRRGATARRCRGCGSRTLFWAPRDQPPCMLRKVDTDKYLGWQSRAPEKFREYEVEWNSEDHINVVALSHEQAGQGLVGEERRAAIEDFIRQVNTGRL